MKRSLLFTCLAAAACGVLGGASRVATSAGQNGALVRLQATFPGTAQTGNINVTGIIRGGTVNLDSSDSNIIANSSSSYSIRAVSLGSGTTAIWGLTTRPDSSGVWGENTSTGTQGLLGYADSGVYGYNGGVATNWAGNFQGNTHVLGKAYIENGFGGTPTVNLAIGDTDTGLNSAGDGQLDVYSNNTKAMSFRNGRVGIGTSTPAVPFETVGYAFFSGASPHSISINNSALQVLEMGIAGGNGQFSTSAVLNDGILRNIGGGAIHLQSGSAAAAMTISGTNRVGIGTNAPVAKLNVVESSTSTTTSAARIYGDNQGAGSFSGGFWAGGLEVAGANGIVGATNRSGGFGTVGYSPDTIGVYGYGSSTTASNYGVFGRTDSGTNGFGVFSNGRTGASGTKSFRIDHPQDPLNKYLLHYSSEGPEPLNIYRGTITTDAKGEAWVQLPSYYADINKDPSYQLTVVDDTAGPGFVQVKVAKKIKDNRFMIMTSAPNIEVCWEVKALRNDAFVQKYGAPVEVNKSGREKGKYQHPELYGAPPEMGMNFSQSPNRDNPDKP